MSLGATSPEIVQKHGPHVAIDGFRSVHRHLITLNGDAVFVSRSRDINSVRLAFLSNCGGRGQPVRCSRNSDHPVAHWEVAASDATPALAQMHGDPRLARF